MLLLDDAFWTLAESAVDLSKLTEKEKQEVLKYSRMNFSDDVKKRSLPQPTQEELMKGYRELDIVVIPRKISKKQEERENLCFRAYFAVRKAYEKTEAELLKLV